MSRCQYVHDGLGRFGNVGVFGIIAESDSEVVLLCPFGQDRFDVVVLGASHIDLVSDDVCGNLTTLDSVSRPKDSSEVPGFRLERVLS